MKKTELHKLDAVVSQFIQKANKKNEPLEAFRESVSFEQFISKIEQAIFKQAQWLGKNLDQIDFLKDEALTTSEFDAKLGGWLSNAMPRITEYVSQDKVYAYLYNAFIFSMQASYARIGVIQKASGFVEFELTNQYYIAALKDQANYLLHRSSIDETTRKRMITLIRDSRLNLDTLDELATMIEAEFEGISATRAYQIANTETNQAMSTAQDAFLRENGFQTKRWIPAGPNTCDICEGNADDGPVPLDQAFSSGDMTPPGHPGCECYEDAGEEIDLDSIPVLWDGSDNGFSRSFIANRERDTMLKRLEKKVGEEIKKTQEDTDAKVSSLKTDVTKSVQSLSETIIDDRKAAKEHLEKALTKLSDKITPEHKTIIQKADVPDEIIQVLTSLAAIATSQEPEPLIPLSEYKPHDEEEGDTDYYGFLHRSGAWYIVEGTDDQQRYAAGSTGYSKAWAKKEDLDYTYIDEAFK